MTLSPRNQKALDGLHSLAGEGWDRSPNARRAECSGLTAKQWRSAVDALVADKLVERLPGTDEERNHGKADALRLTPAGLSSVGMGGHGSGRGVGHWSGIPLGSCSSSPEVQEKKEEEPTNALDEGMPAPMPAGMGHGHGSRAGVWEIRVVHELSAEAREFFALLAHRDGKPDNATPALVERPRCDCGLLMANKNNGEDGRPFLACPKGKPGHGGCGVTCNLDGSDRRRPLPPEKHPSSDWGAAEDALRRLREAHKASVPAGELVRVDLAARLGQFGRGAG